MSPFKDFLDSDENRASLVNLLALILILAAVVIGGVALFIGKLDTEAGVFVGGLLTAGSGLLVKKFLDKKAP